jgi:predicted MFS family arabinose efflux permease
MSFATVTAPAPRALAVVAVGLLGLASAMGIGRFAFTPLLPLMEQNGQLDLAQGAWLAAANYLGYLLGALACARWPMPPAAVARGGLVGVAVFTLAMGSGGGFVVWLAWRLLAGAASALVLVGVSAWALQSLASLQRPGWAGAVFAGVGSGIALAGLVGLGTALSHQSPELAWRLLGVLAALVAVVAWRSFAPSAGRSDPPVSSSAGPGLHGKTWRLVVAYGAFGYGYILPATFLPAMARQQFADPALFGVVWPLFGLAAAVSTLVAPRVSRNASPRALWSTAQLVMAAGVVLPVLSSSLGALLLSAVCVGGTFMVVTMAGMQQARLVAGAAAPQLMAAMTAAFAAGQLLGPLTIGPLGGEGLTTRDSVPFGASLVASAVLVAGAALLMDLSQKRNVRR